MPDARAFLTDFGLARLQETGSRLTRTGQALGTPAYMSPEQARGETATLTPASDVFALACVCYEVLVRRPAFEGATVAALVAATLTREPVRLRRVRADLPATVERVVHGALAKRAAARHRDGGALRDDLDRVLRGEARRLAA